jgi:hypothetical protein
VTTGLARQRENLHAESRRNLDAQPGIVSVSPQMPTGVFRTGDKQPGSLRQVTS